MSVKTRVGLIDDHPLFLLGVQRALARMTDIELAGAGTGFEDAIKLCASGAIDVLLLDLDIPGGGVSALRALRKATSRLKIIIVTGSDDDEHVHETLLAGANGYVLKGANSAEISEAIAAVMAGNSFISQKIATRLLMERIKREPRGTPQERLSCLNHQEKKIFGLMCQGMTNKEIASTLELSVNTVRNYVTKILRLLNARNRVAALQSKSERM